tara:strand:- start:1058 stop:2248 length:1191 start_codon:yes stop_codon:yes gene_type:complete
MINFIYPTESCTLYSHFDVLNTGADEILEIASEFTPKSGPMISRSLLLFSNEDVFSNYTPSNKYYLNLRTVQSIELSEEVSIEVFPVSESWESGRGRFADKEVLYPGASWSFKNQSREHWQSNTNSEYDSGGGSWFHKYKDRDSNTETDIDISQLLNKNTSDIRVDITNIVGFWNASTIQNNGLIVKFRNDEKQRCGNIKFFSSNTNTIYRPFIEIGTNDFIFDPFKSEAHDRIELESGSLDSGSLDSGSLDSGSIDDHYSDTNKKLSENLKEIENKDIILFVKDVNENYSKANTEKIRVGLREKFPVKKFENRMRYSSENITNEDIYFSVIDAETEETIVNFSEFTKISCDSEGHYFMFNFNCLSRGRLYKFILKLESGSISKKFDDNRTFMIVS